METHRRWSFGKNERGRLVMQDSSRNGKGVNGSKRNDRIDLQGKYMYDVYVCVCVYREREKERERAEHHVFIHY